MHFIKTFLTCTAACFAAHAVRAGVTNDFTYALVTNGTITVSITDYPAENTGVAVIPGTIEGHPVTAIEYGPFAACSLSKIVVPDHVTYIEDYAFYNNEFLTNVVLGAGVTDIQKGTFSESPNLASIVIPDSVTNIASKAFLNCYGLSNLVIGSGVTFIGDHAFYECSSMPDLRIPDAVGFIDQWAFANCSGLTDIDFGSGLTNISHYAFSGCAGLTNFTLPSSLNEMGSGVFKGCAQLASAVIPESVMSVHASTFRDCTSLTNAVLPSHLEYLPQSFFVNCVSLETIELPDTITFLQRNIFAGCSNLTHITLPEKTAIMHSYLFVDCVSLSRITIPASVTNLSPSVFRDCVSLAEVYYLGTPVAGNYSSFGNTAATIFYFSDVTNLPAVWNDRPTQSMGAADSTKVWLLENGEPYDADLSSDPNDDGVDLLTAYALDLNPNIDLSGSLPKGTPGPGVFSMTYFAGRTNVDYSVKTGGDLFSWTQNGVLVTTSNDTETASIALSPTNGFLHLTLTELLPEIPE